MNQRHLINCRKKTDKYNWFQNGLKVEPDLHLTFST